MAKELFISHMRTQHMGPWGISMQKECSFKTYVHTPPLLVIKERCQALHNGLGTASSCSLVAAAREACVMLVCCTAQASFRNAHL
jgi:hypothetical protein